MKSETGYCPKCAAMAAMIEARTPRDGLLQKLLDDGNLILYAANCEPKDFAYWMDRGNHYTMNAYFQCSGCGQFFYAGHCLYGRPVAKKATPELAKVQAKRLEWGYLGTAFQNGKI